MFSVNAPRSRYRAFILLCGVALSTILVADTLPVTDPTRPPYPAASVSAQPHDKALLLYSTQVSDTRRSAVINDRVVTVGSRIADAVVTAIAQGRVTLRRDSETIVLQLIATPIGRVTKGSS